MKSFLTKITSIAGAAVVLCVGFALTGLGVTVIALLAMFTLAAFGLSLLARPFIQMKTEEEIVVDYTVVREKEAAV